MKNLAEIIRAVMAALGRLVTKSVMVTKKIGGRMIQVAETVTERVFDAAVAMPRAVLEVGGATLKLGAGTVSDIVKAPFRVAGMLLGGKRQPQQAPEQAAAEAQQAAVQQQIRADAAEDSRQILTSLRRVAQARSSGLPPDSAHVSRLPQHLLAYVQSLSPCECDVLARRPTSELRTLISGRTQRADVRSPEQVAAPAAVVDLEAERAARKAEIRAAVRGSMAGQQRSLDDILDRVASA